MTNLRLRTALKFNIRLSIWASYFLMAAMMTCMVITFVNFANRIAPEWRGNYLIVFGFLIALESMYIQRSLRRSSFSVIERMIFHVAEWIIILLSLKLVSYLVRGIEQLWVDLAPLQENFVAIALTPEFLYTAMILFFVWVLSGQFARGLIHLEGDESLLKIEEESGILRVRSEIRDGIASMIIFVGAVMVFITALLRMDQKIITGDNLPLRYGVVNLLVYFLFALVLLSLTQFSMQRVNWILDRFYIHKGIAGKWLLYTFLFILVISVLASLLPTGYSVGLLEAIRSVFAYIFAFVGFLLTLLSIPFIYLFGLLFSLLGRSEESSAVPEIPEFTPPPSIAGVVPDWWEVVKTLLFWGIILIVIFGSFIIYFREHRELSRYIRKLPFYATLSRFWLWLRSIAGGVQRRIADSVESGLQRLRGIRVVSNGVRRWNYLHLGRLSPRQKILFYYLALIRRGSESGHPRHPAQTPYEYSEMLVHEFKTEESGMADNEDSDLIAPYRSSISSDVKGLTDQFISARYSSHDVPENQAILVRQYWQKIRKVLRRTH